MHTGPVRLAVEVRDQPPELQADPWEEVVECTVHSAWGRLHVVAEGGDIDVFPTLTPHGPGDYRVRCHARGRDIAFDSVVREPVETYLLQIWPAPPAPDVVHKQTDERGRNLRLSAATPPNPDIMRANEDVSRAGLGGAYPSPSEPDTELVIPQRADPSVSEQPY